MTMNDKPGTRRKALEAEAVVEETNSDIRKFDFRGVHLTVPMGDEMEIETMRFWEEGKVVLFVMAAVGDIQWRKLQAAKVNKVKDLKELARAIFEIQGTSAGE